MNYKIKKDIPLYLWPLILAIIIAITQFILQGNTGFNLWDEGFLWYGAKQTLAGEIPIRDFMAYDPGRYYWSASIMALLNDNGILSLRLSVLLFQIFGLLTGLILIAQNMKNKNILFLIISGLILIFWMHPRHKLFDISLSIFLVGLISFLISKPVIKRYFLTGIGVGFIATFGRNHGLYGVIASLITIIWLNIWPTNFTNLRHGFISWSLGVISGYSPILILVLFVPGFGSSFLESVRFLFEQQSTNIPLPIPWPWVVDFAPLATGEIIRQLLIGIFFLGLIIFSFCSICFVIWQKIHRIHVSSSFVSASFLSLPYSHYAFSRADVNHLAQGIFPVLIGTLLLITSQQGRFRWLILLILCIASIWVMYIYQPAGKCFVINNCQEIEISGNRLKIDPATAQDVNLLRKLAKQYAPDGQTFIATPFWPGAYALLDRKSPVWEIYALFHRDPVFEKSEIEQIKTAKPHFVLILDLALDQRDDLRFKNTHPLTHQYILDHFVRLPDSPSSAYQIFIPSGRW